MARPVSIQPQWTFFEMQAFVARLECCGWSVDHFSAAGSLMSKGERWCLVVLPSNGAILRCGGTD